MSVQDETTLSQEALNEELVYWIDSVKDLDHRVEELHNEVTFGQLGMCSGFTITILNATMLLINGYMFFSRMT